MNWKALQKTITPSKDFFILLGVALAATLFIVVVVSVLSIGISLGLKYLLGKVLATYVLFGGLGAWSLWELVIFPLRERYKRISQGQK